MARKICPMLLFTKKNRLSLKKADVFFLNQQEKNRFHTRTTPDESPKLLHQEWHTLLRLLENSELSGRLMGTQRHYCTKLQQQNCSKHTWLLVEVDVFHIISCQFMADVFSVSTVQSLHKSAECEGSGVLKHWYIILLPSMQ